MADSELAFIDGISKEERRKAGRKIIQRRYYIKNAAIRTKKAREKYMMNLDNERARSARWKKENPDKVKAAEKARQARQPKNNERSEEWREKNRIKNSLYYQSHKQEVAAKVRVRRSKKNGAAGSYSAADVEKLNVAQKGKCSACEIKLTKGNRHVDHIIPIALGGTNYPRNLQLLCAFCNKSKGARHPIDFAQARGLLL